MARASDYFVAAVADGKAEDIEILLFEEEPCLTQNDLSDEQKKELLILIRDTQYKRTLRKGVESPGTPDGLINIILVYGRETIGCYGGVVSWLYSAQYGWYIGIYNENLSRWMQDYIAGSEEAEREPQGAIPGIREVEEAYQKAKEAFYWFEVDTMPTESSYVEANGTVYHKVKHNTIKTCEDLENYLHSLFTGDIVVKLLPREADFPRYRDFDGALHAMVASRGTSLFKGMETLTVTQESDVKFICTVRVELLDEKDAVTVTGYEIHEYSYELIDGWWVFTNFYLFR